MQGNLSLESVYSSSLLIGRKVVLHLRNKKILYIYISFKIILCLHLDAECMCLISEY